MSDIIYIGEHKYELPPIPKKPVKFTGIFGDTITIPLDDLIIGRNLPYEEAYWKRCELPKFFYDYNPYITEIDADETVWHDGELISLSKEDTKTLSYLFEREMYRRKNGVFFKNGDEIVYLTGHHYFFLQWMKLYGISEKMVPSWRPKGYEYAEYREFQRDIFYLIDKVNNDPDILGLYVAKAKKTGVTQMFAAYRLNKATMTRMAMMGVMSIGNNAVNVNMKLFFHGFDNLPLIFKPSVRYRGDQEGHIEFGEMHVKNIKTLRGRKRMLEILNSNPLDTKVFAAKTKAAGFDSPTMTDIEFDEFPKYDTENKQEPEVVFLRNRDTVKIQNFINGKIWIYSYPPEVDTKGFFQARKIYFDAKLSTIKDDETGQRRTANGLICHYVSSLNSYMECFDKYGKCDSKRAKLLNNYERNRAKGKREKQALMRLYSETERECWGTSGAGSTFDNVRLSEIEYNLKNAYERGERFFIEGRYEWANSLWEAGSKTSRPLKEFCEVKFIPLTDNEKMDNIEGRKRIYHPFEANSICAALRRGRDSFGNLMPPTIITTFGGVDPTDYAAGSSVVQGSKNASITMNFKNPSLDRKYGKICTGIIQSEYFYRPDNPEEFYQDICKEIIYEDKVVMVESNKAWVATRLIKDGLGRFLIVQNKETKLYQLWQPVMFYKGAWVKDDSWYTLPQCTPSGDEKGAIVRSINKFLAKPADGEIDYASLIRSENCLLYTSDAADE